MCSQNSWLFLLNRDGQEKKKKDIQIYFLVTWDLAKIENVIGFFSLFVCFSRYFIILHCHQLQDTSWKILSW